MTLGTFTSRLYIPTCYPLCVHLCTAAGVWHFEVSSIVNEAHYEFISCQPSRGGGARQTDLIGRQGTTICLFIKYTLVRSIRQRHLGIVYSRNRHIASYSCIISHHIQPTEIWLQNKIHNIILTVTRRLHWDAYLIILLFSRKIKVIIAIWLVKYTDVQLIVPLSIDLSLNYR